MRVVNIMLAKGLGGIEQSFLDYTHTLQRRGHEVHSVIHPRSQVGTLLDSPPQHIYILSNWGAWDIMAASRLKSLLRTLKPDVVIAHGNRSLDLAARAKARPLVAVLHNYKIHLNKASAYLAPSRDLIRHALEQGVKRERLHLVPNMVATPEDMPQREWRVRPVIGAMGRMVPKKGFEVFLAALAILRSRQIEFRAVLAGEGEEMEALKSQAQREGIAYEVEFTGWVTQKSDFFNAIDIFCLPSHHEPFGIVLLEAMAHGLPVISTASEGPSEILTHQMNGFLSPVGDATAMADAIEDMLFDPRRAQLMARNGFDTVKEQYDYTVGSQKLELALRACCAL